MRRLLSLSQGFLFVFFFLLYALMSSPGLEWGDAGEAQLAAWTAGLSHPTGYPLFLMLGWLWSHALALLGVAPTRAMTLLSVTAGAATVAMLLPATQALLRRAWLGLSEGWTQGIGAVTALFFGFSLTFWSQALLAEVYTLNALFLTLLLWSLWTRGHEPRWLPWLALLYGVALSHHRTMILWAPGLLLWLWLEQREAFRPRRLLGLLCLVALPQLLYLYIAWRGPRTAYLHQPLAGGEVLELYDGTIRAFVSHVTGTVFATDLGLKESLGARLRTLWQLMEANVTLPLLVIALLASTLPLPGRLGVLLSLRLSDRLLLWSGAIFTLLFGLFYAIGDVEVMFIPAWLALSLLGFGGVAVLVRHLLIAPELSARVAMVGSLLLLLVPLRLQLAAMPLSRAANEAPRARVDEILAANPPPNAILVTNDRDELVPLWYAQFAEGQRRDLLVLAPLMTPAPEHRTVGALVQWALQWGRPVLLAKPMAGLAQRYELRPDRGPLVEVQGPAAMPAAPPLHRDLAPSLAVSGWEPSERRVQPGDLVTVSVALLPAAPLADALSFSLQLFDSAGAPVAQAELPPDPFFPSTDWPVGEPVRLRFPLPLPADARAGLYEWRLSSYLLEEARFTPVGQQVSLGRFLVGARPPALPPDAASAALARFGDSILLVSAASEREVWRTGENFTFTLTWLALDAPRYSYTLFVHLLDEQGALVAQGDAPPTPPTDVWVRGDRWQEARTLPLPAELPPGRYTLRIGLYDEAGRVPVAAGGDSVEIGAITVVQ